LQQHTSFLTTQDLQTLAKTNVSPEFKEFLEYKIRVLNVGVSRTSNYLARLERIYTIAQRFDAAIAQARVKQHKRKHKTAHKWLRYVLQSYFATTDVDPTPDILAKHVPIIKKADINTLKTFWKGFLGGPTIFHVPTIPRGVDTRCQITFGPIDGISGGTTTLFDAYVGCAFITNDKDKHVTNALQSLVPSQLKLLKPLVFVECYPLSKDWLKPVEATSWRYEEKEFSEAFAPVARVKPKAIVPETTKIYTEILYDASEEEKQIARSEAIKELSQYYELKHPKEKILLVKNWINNGNIQLLTCRLFDGKTEIELFAPSTTLSLGDGIVQKVGETQTEKGTVNNIFYRSTFTTLHPQMRVTFVYQEKKTGTRGIILIGVFVYHIDNTTDAESVTKRTRINECITCGQMATQKCQDCDVSFCSHKSCYMGHACLN